MTKHFIDPIKEAKAAAALKESIVAMLGDSDDETLVLDTIEGETNFFEAVDRILGDIAEDDAMVDAIDGQVAALKARKERFKKRAETRKALLEQAWIVADLPKSERPMGTVYLSNRAPKVVIETESDIPTRYWKPADPVLDAKLLGDDLKARREMIDAVLAGEDDAREAAVEAFHQRFLTDDEAESLRGRLTAFAAIEDAEIREKTLADLRRDFTNLPGATLSNGSRSLSIRSA